MQVFVARFGGCKEGVQELWCAAARLVRARAWLALLVFTLGSSVGSAAPPNVVVIMADDLDAASVDVMVANGLMPNLKRYLIDEGTRFTNSFVTTSWCCPSRATFFTGQYSHNHGVLSNGRPFGGVTRFRDASTLATWLRKAGYRTGLVGKYLNQYGSDADPNTPVDNPTYIPPGWDDWQAILDSTITGRKVFQMYDYTLNDNGTLVAFGAAPSDYQTDVLARRAREFINESGGLNDAQPFFLVVTPVAPHLERPGPTLSGCANPKWNGTIRPAPRHVGTLPAAITLPRPPSFNEAVVSDKPAFLRAVPRLTTADVGCLTRQYRDHLEALRAIDDLIGGIVSTLSTNGELGNSVIIFTSDNGFYYGEHRLTDKVLGYEPSIRVPLVIRAPGFKGPKTATPFVLNNDLAPTIAAFAGAVPGLAVDGRSLIPLLNNPTAKAWRKRFLVEYIATAGESPQTGPRQPFSAVRTTPLDGQTPNRFYVEWNDPPPKSRELYNLVADPYQLRSEHANAALSGVRTALAGWLARLKSCGKGTCRTLEDQ